VPIEKFEDPNTPIAEKRRLASFISSKLDPELKRLQIKANQALRSYKNAVKR
jgi:hypothetical protein